MPFRIFVSSTSLDLREESEAVELTFQGPQNIYAALTYLPAIDPREAFALDTLTED